MIKHNLSPSLIARYFYHNCDRFLRYHATPKKYRKMLGIPLTNVTKNLTHPSVMYIFVHQLIQYPPMNYFHRIKCLGSYTINIKTTSPANHRYFWTREFFLNFFGPQYPCPSTIKSSDYTGSKLI